VCGPLSQVVRRPRSTSPDERDTGDVAARQRCGLVTAIPAERQPRRPGRSPDPPPRHGKVVFSLKAGRAFTVIGMAAEV